MKMTYWISTSVIAIFLLWSTYGYIFSKSMIDGLKELGFPDFFRVQLAVLKFVAVFVLMIPAMPIQFKEWAYAGVGLFFVTAIVAHIVHKDPIAITLLNIVLFIILIVSNISLHRLLSSS